MFNKILITFFIIKKGCFYLNRMVPPRSNIKYYFSTDGSSNILIAKDHEII